MAETKAKEEGTAAPPEVKKEKAFVAGNVKNQTMEFCIRGRWIRWEPKGKPGSIREISKAEAMDHEFRRLAALYFDVKEASK